MLFYKVRGILSDEIDRVCGEKGAHFREGESSGRRPFAPPLKQNYNDNSSGICYSKFREKLTFAR